MYNIYTKAISKRGWFTLLALIATICVSAQNVKGVVVDETDMPMIGATVMVKGSQTGTTTDFDGNFTIQAQKGSTLVFSYIGYKNQEVPDSASGTSLLLPKNCHLSHNKCIDWKG